MGYKIGSTQKGFALGPIIAPSQPTQAPWEQSLTQKYALGASFTADDGRVWHYAKVGAVAIAAGELQQSAAFAGSTATVQTDITPTAAAIGATTVVATLATDAAVKDLFADGWCSVSDGGAAIGQGEYYKIVGNKAAGAGAAMTFTLNRPLVTAWTSSTRLALSTNLYKSVIQVPVTTVTGFAVGVPNIAMDIGYYGWLQTWGWCNVLIKTALTMGTNVVLDVAAAGSLGVFDGALINCTLGHAGVVVATTDSGLVYLQIAR